MKPSLFILNNIKQTCKFCNCCADCSYSIKEEGTENRNIVIGCKLEGIPSEWKIGKEK